MAASALFASEGVQKALSFLCLALVGNRLKGRFSAAQISGVQRLVLDACLPCVIFKALCSVALDASLLKWPLLGAAFVAAQLAGGAAIGAAAFPGDALATPRRTAAAQLGTAAPGLSAVVFVREFVGDGAAGRAALFDLPMKLYMIVAMPALLRRRGAGRGRPSKKAAGTRGLGDPLHCGIGLGLLMAVARVPLAALGPAARAVDALAAAQTPVLFVLIGLKLDLAGATPAVCVAVLLARHAAAYAGYAAVYHFSDLLASEADALTALFLVQSAVAVVGWSQMSRAADAGVAGYDLDFAFDVVGFSMPLAVALQTAACLSDAKTAARRAATTAPPLFAALAALAFSATKAKARDPAAWPGGAKAD